jgi:hypothetical protein
LTGLATPDRRLYPSQKAEVTVTTETTAPFAGQASAIEMLTELIIQFPELPDAYITIQQPWQGAASRLDFNIDTPTGFEQWRTALAITPDA